MRTLLAMMVALVGCSEPVVDGNGEARGAVDGDLSVVTYNVNFERVAGETLAVVAGFDADLVLLQETHTGWEDGLRDAASGKWPHVLFRDHDPDGGMAVLSRLPVTEVGWVASPTGGFPAWCLVVDGDAPLSVLAVHLQPPIDGGGLVSGFFSTGGAREQEIRAHLTCGSAPDLVLGDFNEGEGAAITALTNAGFVEAQSAFLPLEYTWEWDTTLSTLRGRPDHVFSGPRLRPRGVQVMRVGASDHRPVRAVYEVVP